MEYENNATLEAKVVKDFDKVSYLQFLPRKSLDLYLQVLTRWDYQQLT